MLKRAFFTLAVAVGMAASVSAQGIVPVDEEEITPTIVQDESYISRMPSPSGPKWEQTIPCRGIPMVWILACREISALVPALRLISDSVVLPVVHSEPNVMAFSLRLYTQCVP